MTTTADDGSKRSVASNAAVPCSTDLGRRERRPARPAEGGAEAAGAGARVGAGHAGTPRDGELGARAGVEIGEDRVDGRVGHRVPVRNRVRRASRPAR